MAATKAMGSGPRSYLTVEQVCEELQITRRAFENWRARGAAPHCIKLPGGGLRVRRGDLDTWLEQLDEAG